LRSSSKSAASTARLVRPEHLDELPPHDPRAGRSRRDLRRVHRVMGSLQILVGAITRLDIRVSPRRILELGGGDGTLLLRLLRAMRGTWLGGDVSLLDKQDLLSTATRREFAALGWNVETLRTDAIEWARSATREQYDLCLTNLFLHHFRPRALAELLAAIESRTGAFIACEPRRNTLSRVGSRLLFLLGANDVTRHDAAISVDAGFAALELTGLWPAGCGTWHIEEYFARPFTHCFAGRRSRSFRS